MTIYDILTDIENTLGFDRSEAIEVVREAATADDFEVVNHRFIKASEIDEIQCNELENDTYVLGCFNADFLANVLDISYDAIKKFQESEAFEGIGELIVSQGLIELLQQNYVSADGYGHHFAHYDHHEHELLGNWYAFRIN